ncbi:MAG: hypothetical protein WCO57_03905 [Verrucomicrobiota bacterium]
MKEDMLRILIKYDPTTGEVIQIDHGSGIVGVPNNKKSITPPIDAGEIRSVMSEVHRDIKNLDEEDARELAFCLAVKIRKIALPEYLEQPGIVLDERWCEKLGQPTGVIPLVKWLEMYPEPKS